MNESDAAGERSARRFVNPTPPTTTSRSPANDTCMKKLTLLLLLFPTFSVVAQSLVYRPVNPAFGGDTFNYNWLLASAQAQDKSKDPAAAATSASRERDALENFQSTLNSQLLGALARNLYSNQFGEDGLQEGVYKFGELTVDISPGSTGLIIRISDGKGGETNLTVPYY